MDKLWSLSIVVVVLLVVVKIWRACKAVFWRPYVLTRFFEKQGIRGPPYTPLYGSLPEIKKLGKAAHNLVLDVHQNDIIPTVVPHYFRWFKEYGETFLYWYGTKPRLVVTDPELSKQILSNKFGFYVKPKTKPSLIALMGYGLATVDGSVWARHRRILNPAFSIDKLKVMVKRMAACTISMLEEWNNQAATDQGLELEMNKEFQKLTADIISHTSFGSNYLQGREAFEAQKKLQRYCAVSNADLFIPGSQYLPTPSNLKIQKLESKIRNALKGIIEGRIKSKATGNASDRYGDDLLGQMIGASETGSTKDCPSLNKDEIMDECKTFFFAGHETTSNLLTWTSFLLSLHQDWQETLRQEVLEECGTQIPDADTLAKLKITNMVLLEVLRLYCPVIMLMREASEDMKLGNLRIPKGTGLVIPVVKIHRSKEYWGEDANDFNPLRFSNGVSKAAKHPNALLAFSIGPRACIGQNFAMMEAKTVLALLLQRFRFSLSPQYKHMPADNLTLLPKYGLPIIVKPLNA